MSDEQYLREVTEEILKRLRRITCIDDWEAYFYFDKTARYFGWKFGFDGRWLNFVGNITGIKNPSVQFDVNRFIDDIQNIKDFKSMWLSRSVYQKWGDDD